MKRLLAVLGVLASLLLGSPAWAGHGFYTVVASTTLDDDPTSVSGTVFVGDATRFGFFVNYDETQVGNSVSVAVTVQISYDNVTYFSASFLDFAGGPSTFQTSETISADGDYFFWFHQYPTMPYVKVILTATNTDTDDIAVVKCNMFTTE